MMAKVGVYVGRENLQNSKHNHLDYNKILLPTATIPKMLAMLATSLRFSMWIQYQRGKNALIQLLFQLNKASSQHCQQKTLSNLFHWKLATYIPPITTNRSANFSLQAPTKERSCRYFQ